MTVRTCLPFPDRRLRTAADPVEAVTDDIRAIWQDMIDTMEAMPGVGLAATQIGIMLRLAVVDGSAERGRAVRLANPEIIDTATEMRPHEEASPNLPGISARIERPARVTVQYLDEQGVLTQRDFEGLESTSVQHQIDHLNGRLYIDHLSRAKRDMLLRKLRKMAQAKGT